MIVKATEIDVIPIMLAQYGSPITAFNATQGVNTVTAKFKRLRMTYEKLARHLTSFDLNLEIYIIKRN